MKGVLLTVLCLHMVWISSAKTVLGDDGILRVFNMKIETDQQWRKLQRLNSSKVALLNPKITNLTADMLHYMGNVKMLFVQDGEVHSVAVTKQFVHLNIFNCSTSRVQINPTTIYKMKHLGVVFGKLKRVPEHLYAMKLLENLYLHDNEIEFVDIAQLSGLQNLKLLALQNNRIARFCTTTKRRILFLPKLEEFGAESNQLRHVNFTAWNATLVERVILNENRLVSVDGLTEAFPELKQLNLRDNELDCNQTKPDIDELIKRKVHIWYKEELDCKNDDQQSNLRRAKQGKKGRHGNNKIKQC